MAIFLNDTQPRAESPAEHEPAESRRRRDPEATRKAIMDAAEDLFVLSGPAGTSMSRIAKRADVTKSLIHHHFGSKEELWEAVQERHFAKYFEIQMELLEQHESTESLLEESLIAYFRFLQSDPRSVRFMSWRFVEEEDGQCAADPEKQLFEIGIQKIAEAQEKGRIRKDLEPFFIIKTLIALPFAWFQTHSMTLSMLDSEIEPRELDERYMREMVKIFFEGVRPRENDSESTSAS